MMVPSFRRDYTTAVKNANRRTDTAQVLAKEWRREYNQVRPHSSLGYRTPAEYGAMVPRADSAALRRPEEPSVTVDPTLTAPGP
jgi:transposase InsO family protein